MDKNNIGTNNDELNETIKKIAMYKRDESEELDNINIELNKLNSLYTTNNTSNLKNINFKLFNKYNKVKNITNNYNIVFDKNIKKYDKLAKNTLKLFSHINNSK